MDGHLRLVSESDDRIFDLMHFSEVPIDAVTRDALAALLQELKHLHGRSSVRFFGHKRLLQAESLSLIHKSREFLAGVRSSILVLEGQELQLTVGSWADLYKKLPPSQIPSVYMLIVLLTEIAQHLMRISYPSWLYQSLESLDERGFAFEQRVCTSADHAVLCHSLPLIADGVFHANGFQQLAGGVTDSARQSLTDRRDNPTSKKCDNMAGMMYIYETLKHLSGALPGREFCYKLYPEMPHEEAEYIKSAIPPVQGEHVDAFVYTMQAPTNTSGMMSESLVIIDGMCNGLEASTVLLSEQRNQFYRGMNKTICTCMK